MELQNYYWCFQGALPNRICDDIVAYGNALKEETGVTFGYDPNNMTPNQQKQLEQKRKSNVVWMDARWIYRELHPLVHEANSNAGWNYHWDWSEPCQFTKYDGSKKQHYDWHTDAGLRANENGKIRKLSMTVALVDGNEYEGGDFEINMSSPEKENIHVVKQAKIKGSVTIFPSFVWHRVKPVTAGTRYSLVNWHQGRPFV
jgi:PKHD-type hydroxylase